MQSLRSSEGVELIRALVQRVLQELIEAEATAHIGAEPGEHTETAAPGATATGASA
ncbi:hypothetical protein [Streptomyces anthocyanicus]|uniref:hypothetical protein n=1 Tax=Streptomyces anthocyanicus TaxID=68174 RepID=UPI002F914B3D|nr:transposase [Streptomyces anthocyanicus]